MTRTKQTGRKRKIPDSEMQESEAVVQEESAPTNKKPDLEQKAIAQQKKAEALKKKTAMLEAKPLDEYIHVSNLSEMLEKLPPHGLASVFKTLLHFYSQDGSVNVQYPKYTSTFQDNGKWRTYTTTVDFKGTKYQSAGPMFHPKQGEQSAAEVCLRSLGYLKAVTNDDDLIIQPYRGGSVGEQFIHRFDSLMSIAAKELGFKPPKYLVKTTEKDGGDFTSVVMFHGKRFEGESPERKQQLAKQRVATLILKWFGLHKPIEMCRLSKLFTLKKYKTSIPLSQYQSPISVAPSIQSGWLNLRFQKKSINMDGENGPEEARKSTMEILDETQTDLLEQLLNNEPSFNGNPFSSLEHLSVGEVFADDPNLLRIGNEKFSIMMYCKDRKIHCQNRGKDVTIMPGHQIRGLKCSYKVSFPSLEVYVKAEHCSDLNFPNPPLPVVTNFKEIMMMHDHEAEGKVYILLKREVEERTFIKCAFKLKDYLKELIESDEEKSLDLDAFEMSIDTWSLKEVELLSQMTMDSMTELFSDLFDYDDRCNEIFFSEDLPEDLKKLKNMCIEELKNRKKKKGRATKAEKVETGAWKLPSMTFQHRLTGVGVFTETEVFCLNRGIYENTGLKIKINEIENSRHFDEPCKDNKNPHRGDVCRYHIWCKCRKYSKGEEDIYHSEELKALEKTDANWVQSDRIRQRRERKERKGRLPTNPQQVTPAKRLGNPKANPWKEYIEAFSKNGDASEAQDEKMAVDVKKVNASEKENGEEREGENGNENEGENEGEDGDDGDEKNKTKVDNDDNREGDVEDEQEEADQSSVPEHLERIHEECRWFTLEEAKRESKEFAAIITNEIFTKELEKLRAEGEEYIKSKDS